MKLLLALAGLLTVVGLVWLAISVDDAAERGRMHAPLVTPVGVLTPAESAERAGEAALTAPAQLATEPQAPPVAEDEPQRPRSAVPPPAPVVQAYVPPDPARYEEAYRDIDGADAAQRAAQLDNRVELHAASVLSDLYYKEGRYSAWPYTYDARGTREPATSSIPPAELEPIHRIYDAPDERAWHLVVLPPELRPDLYDLRHESRWLGSRARAGDG